MRSSLIKIDELKKLTHIVLPLTAAFLSQKGMQVIDTVMMGWIGPQALAAGALGTAIFTLILVFCRGTLSAVGIFVARGVGIENPADIQSSLQQGIYVALLLSIPGMLIIWYAPYLLGYFHETPGVVEKTLLLLHGLCWGFPALLLFFVFREFTTAFSVARVVMLISLLSLPLTFLANYLLIYGKFGLPTLGIAGIGYGGAGVMYFMFFSLFVYCKQHHTLKNYLVFNSYKPNLQRMFGLLYLGIPSGLLIALDVGMFLVSAIMIGYFGINSLAAYQIVIQYISIAYNIPLALSMATALQVAQAAGLHNLSQAKRYAFLGLSMGLIVSFITALIFLFAHTPLIHLFGKFNAKSDREINEIATMFLAAAALFQCVDALQIISIGILRGLKDTLIPMLFTIPCYWLIGMGSAYYLAFQTHFNAIGIWYGLLLGLGSGAMLSTIRLFQKFKQPLI